MNIKLKSLKKVESIFFKDTWIILNWEGKQWSCDTFYIPVIDALEGLFAGEQDIS